MISVRFLIEGDGWMLDMLDLMVGIPILTVAFIVLVGILAGSDVIPGENWMGIFGTTLVVVDCAFCLIYAYKFAPAASTSDINAMAATLVIVLMFGIASIAAGNSLRKMREKRRHKS